MKTILFILFLLFTTASYSEVVYITSNKYDCDMKVYFVNNKYEADRVIKITSDKYKARATKDFWFFEDTKYTADIVVYITDKQHKYEKGVVKVYIDN